DLTRRTFLRRSAGGIGAVALGSLLNPQLLFGETASGPASGPVTVPGILGHTHFAPKAKRIIYLCQSGAPSQIELFDYKPGLDQLRAGKREQRPAGVRGDDLARHRTSARSAALRPIVGQRFSADAAPGREIPRRRGSGAVPLQSAGCRSINAPAAVG